MSLTRRSLGRTLAFAYADRVGGRRRAAVIRAVTGDDVIIGEAELRHAMRHFTLPRDLALSLISRVLENPTIVLVLVGAFFASMYPTGRSIRPSHRRFRRVLP